VAALACAFALLHLAGTNDLLSEATRPVVVGVLRLVGVAAHDAGGGLAVGRMHVPWSRDCAGVNTLTLLWALTLWANRSEPLNRRFWLRLALAIPAALGANIARIFTLLAYRYAFYPAVEPPQLHYFIGFLWVMPCLPLLVATRPEPGRARLETLFLVSALALLSPYVPAPGGNLVTVATLLLLIRSRYQPLEPGGRWLGGLWMAAAPGIAAASMESLWIPWLLSSPWFAPRGLRGSPSRLMLLVGTVPLVAMQPVGRWLVVLAGLWELRMLAAPGAVTAEAAAPVAARPSWTALAGQAGIALLLVFPFMAATITGLGRPSLRPPAGVMLRVVAPNACEVRLVGQPAELQLVWYGPAGDGRHHTLPVCMRYRGIALRPSGLEPSVLTDGRVWMREFFIQDRELLLDYATYLRRTFLPWSPAGVHLIASAARSNLTAAAFARGAEGLARELWALGDPLPDRGPALSPENPPRAR
jgi:exosortase/archaeosortase family protein